MAVDWEALLGSTITKAVDLEALRRMQKMQPAPAPASTGGAVPAPGLDGQPIKKPLDGRWLVGGALVFAALLLYKVKRG